MRISIDKNVEKLLPWELDLEIDGRWCPTRRPSMATILQLQGKLTNQEAIDLMPTLFSVPVDALNWEPAEVAMVTFSYMAYFNEFVRKNSQAAFEISKAAIEAHRPHPVSKEPAAE